MATIRREVHIQADPDQVWDALRDVGQPRSAAMIEAGIADIKKTQESAHKVR